MSHVIGWLVGALAFFGGSHAAPAPQVAPIQSSTTAKVQIITPTTAPTVRKAPKTVTVPPTVKIQPPQIVEVIPTPQTTQLSNDNYYTNVDGNTVHSPAYTEDDSVPVGASARCRDGTYSFSQNRRGTCSRHGGVAEWL